jgi:hypothetical protein
MISVIWWTAELDFAARHLLGDHPALAELRLRAHLVAHAELRQHDFIEMLPARAARRIHVRTAISRHQHPPSRPSAVEMSGTGAPLRTPTPIETAAIGRDERP